LSIAVLGDPNMIMREPVPVRWKTRQFTLFCKVVDASETDSAPRKDGMPDKK
jgi:hypothetical protein